MSSSTNQIALNCIELPNAWNRQRIRCSNELIESIKNVGQLTPLLVRAHPTDINKVVLVDGRRRLYALQELGIATANISYIDADTDGSAYLAALIVNIGREDNTAYEKATAFQHLITRYAYTHESLAAACGKSVGYISQYLSVFKASDQLQAALAEDKISITIFRLFNRLDITADQPFYNDLATSVINANLTYSSVEARIDNYLSNADKKSTSKKGAAAHKKAEPISLVDYNTVTIAYKSEDEVVNLLNQYQNELVASTKKLDRRYYEGIMDGIELICGLRDFAD